MKRFLRWAQYAMFGAATLLLGWSGYTVLESYFFQRQESRLLDEIAQGHQLAGKAPVEEGLIGRIAIARLELSVMITEGGGTKTLRRGAGHIPGTALPGESGNIGISAHRDTYFRPLRNVRQNDIIVITTPSGEFRYSVVSTKIVGPDDVSVLDPSRTETLTLVTCYPFYFVGPAPDRFIVRAKRVT